MQKLNHAIRRAIAESVINGAKSIWGVLALIGIAAASSSQTLGADAISSAPGRSVEITIPPNYGASQVGPDARAFQFQMPNGDPVSHDFGLEGMPDISLDQPNYPVVVNEIRSDLSKWENWLPNRQLANTLVGSELWGLSVGFLDRMVVLTPIKRIGYSFYYAQLASPEGTRGQTNVFFRCPDAERASSSCDGWEYSQGLGIVFHIRFPRSKASRFREISAVALEKLTNWKR